MRTVILGWITCLICIALGFAFNKDNAHLNWQIAFTAMGIASLLHFGFTMIYKK